MGINEETINLISNIVRMQNKHLVFKNASRAFTIIITMSFKLNFAKGSILLRFKTDHQELSILNQFEMETR